MAELPEPLGLSRMQPSEPKASILLVDDNPANLLSLRAILEELRQNLVEAHSGEEALKRVRSEEFAVVLLDVLMPGMNGFETAKLIRDGDRSRHTPIIFLTAGDIDRSQLEKGYALGAVDFLVKPLLPIILRAKVKGFIELFQDKQRTKHEADQLRLLVHGTTEYAIFMLDPQGQIVTWNAGAERIKQYKAEEIIGQHFSRFYPQDAIDRGWPDHELKVAQAEGRFEDEGWRVRKDGTQFWANVVITALRDEQGQLRGFSKVTRDLTARKQVEENLRRSEERFRFLVEGAKDYAIFMLDPQGYIASWNPGAERIKGYSAQEIIGQHFSTFYPQEALDRGWPAHELKVAAAEGRFEDEGWRVRKDGTQFWANVVITALKDERANLLGFSKITRDLTARKQAEEDARRLVEETTARRVAEENARLVQEQRERLHVTLASIGDAVISTDAEGRVDFLNPVAENLVGWKSEEAAHHTLDDVFRIVNEDTRQPVENPALRALKDGVIVGLANHTVLISKDGTERPIDDSAAPIRDEKGGISGSVLVFRDITERKRSEAVLGERMRLLALNAAVGEALVQGTEVEAMLERCAEAMVENLHGAFARIWTLNPLDDVLELRASAGLYTHRDGPHSRVPVGKYKIGLIAQERKPHLTNAVVGDPRVSDQEWAKQEGMVAFAGYPLVVDDRLVGVMAMFARRTLTEATLEAMASVADEIAVGVERKFAQQRLHEQREWLRVTLASIGDAVIATDTLGRVTFLNPVAEQLTCWNQGEAQGRPLESVFVIVNEQTHQPVENPVEKVLRDGVIVGLGNHTVLIARDGTQRPIDDSAAPIRDTSGEMIGVVLIFRDVTEQRRAERELRQSEQELAEFFENATVGLHWVGPDGIILRANKAELDLLGFNREEYVGRPIANFHADEDVICDILKRLNAGEKLTEYPARLRCKNGSIKDVLIDSSVLFRDGEFVHTRCFTRDVTERKRAEDALRQSEQKAHFLADASAALASVVDYESTLQKVANLAVPHFADWSTVDVADDDGTLRRLAVAHQDPEKVQLAHELMRQYPPDPQATSGAFAVLRTGKPEIIGEITDDLLVKGAKDEQHLDLIRSLGLKSYVCVPLVISGKPLGVLTFATAESGRRYTEADLALAMDLAHRASVAVENTQLYQALRDTDRRKDEFLATLAHELRNPLAPIRNALQILKMPRVDQATVQRSREMMERQVHHLVRLVDDLLDVSRVMRGKIELRRERVELATVVARAVETVQPLVDTQGHELSVRISPESLLIDGDPVRLAQVVGNLLTNAAKYTEPGGRIGLTAERDGDVAVLRVRDNGIGIAPQMLPRIFELFVQVDHASTKAQGGLGIGLTLVKNLVEMHNGFVQARSEGLGQGSEFVVRLPLSVVRVEQERGREIEEQVQQPPSPSGYRLMVVDDNQDAADSLAMLLKLQGHEVRVAYSGMAALEMTKTYTPDVAFMDIGMPGMDGYEVARRMRQQPGLENIVLAALTGWGQKEDRRRTAEAGFNHHLVKPPEPKAVESVLAGLPKPNHQK
jgi:PAS domain S-box-containing protein